MFNVSKVKAEVAKKQLNTSRATGGGSRGSVYAQPVQEHVLTLKKGEVAQFENLPKNRLNGLRDYLTRYHKGQFSCRTENNGNGTWNAFIFRVQDLKSN